MRRFFFAFPSVYYDIKRQNNIIPIDYFIPTLFRNHAVEKSMYDRIGVEINNSLYNPNYNYLEQPPYPVQNPIQNPIPPPPPPPPPMQQSLTQQIYPDNYSNSNSYNNNSYNSSPNKNRKKHKRGKGSELKRKLRWMSIHGFRH